MEEATLKIVNTKEQSFEEKYENAKAIYDDSVKEYNEKIANFIEQKFEIDGGIEVATYISEFLKNKAKWTYVESKMIVQIYSNLVDEIELIKSGNQENIRLNSMDIEGINYFMQSYSDYGLETAMDFFNSCNSIIEAFKPTQKFKEILKEDAQRIEIEQFNMNSYLYGVDPSPEVADGITYKADFNQ